MADSAIPGAVQRSVSQLEVAVSDLQKHIRLLTSPESLESLVLLSAADRAAYFLAIAKATNALFCLHLRSSGQSPEKHGVKSELERVNVYHDKVALAIDRNTAPVRPTSSINLPAANRFIEHAVTDLTEEQKQKMRDIGRGGKRSRTWVRNPEEGAQQTTKKQSVMEAAAAFLAQAAKDLVPIQNLQSNTPSDDLLCWIGAEKTRNQSKGTCTNDGPGKSKHSKVEVCLQRFGTLPTATVASWNQNYGPLGTIDMDEVLYTPVSSPKSAYVQASAGHLMRYPVGYQPRGRGG